MKFKSPQDKELFLRDLHEDEYSRLSYEIDESPENTLDAQKYITIKRSNFATRLKDFRKSQTQKANWRAGKYKYLKGIREFARSVEGKQFHRRLSRYIVSTGILRGPRDQRPINPRNPQHEENSSELSRYDTPDLLVSLSSLRTHMLIETRYYQSLSDEVDYFILLEIMIKKLNNMESRILESMMSYTNFDFTQDDIDFLEAVVGDISYDDITED